MASTVPQLVLFGDSLLQQSVDLQNGFSFQAALQSDFIRRLDVVNRGLSGYTTELALKYLPDIFPERTSTSPKIEYLVILFGANDAVLKNSITNQHVPLEQFRENLRKIINHPRILAHRPQIILVTQVPLDEIKATPISIAKGYGRAIRTSADCASYAKVARQVARENPEIILVDLWQALMEKAFSMLPGEPKPAVPWLGSPENGKQGGLDLLLHDGLHMTGEGYQVFYEAFKLAIGNKLQGIYHDDKAGYLVPDYRELFGIPSNINTGD